MVASPPIEQGLLSAIGRSSRLVQRALAAELASFDIGLGEFRVVGLLLDEPDGLSQAELCERLMVTAPTLSVAVRALEERGVVERRPDPEDGRVKRVRVREQADLSEVLGMLSGMEQELGERFSARDLAATKRVLSGVADWLLQRQWEEDE